MAQQSYIVFFVELIFNQSQSQHMYSLRLRINQFSNSVAVSQDKHKYQLLRLFQYQNNKIQLSNNLRLLPNYFDKQYVNQFTTHPYYQQYLKYVETESTQPEDARFRLRNLFNAPRLKQTVGVNTQRRYLESFIHWLFNFCQKFNIYENNYLYEFINLQKPDKFFQQVKNYCPQRTFIYHHGPTNSGKSTSAIQELKKLQSHQKGIYMAPLRLLAWQFQQKLGNCSLITGQQKDYRNSNLTSCTIEATQLNDQYEVAVIDQIQMIGDSQRGWAWTKAILAIKAKRIHLCGDERAINIVSKLIQSTGDILEERKYSRLSKLTLIHKVFKLQDISPGDCMINFSMKSLLRHRNQLNKMLATVQSKTNEKILNKQPKIQEKIDQNNQNKEVIQITDLKLIPKDNNIPDQLIKTVKKNLTAIIYGKLPSEVRKIQAKKFNQNVLPYLVATNAIGMGLNLNIKKIIFMSIQKKSFQGFSQQLQDHQIQQIAGRAGRGTDTGYVQCASSYILQKVKKALSSVNMSYGINLQNIKDTEQQQQQQQQMNKEVADIPIVNYNQVYNSYLKRNLLQKQCRITQACFFFQVQFIIMFILQRQQIFQTNINILEVLNYLKNNCKITNMYFMQEIQHLRYLIRQLQINKFDIQDLFIFYNGLQLSISRGPKNQISNILQYYHKDYVKKFIQKRKVDVPKILVQHYSDNWSKFNYMDQISQLQYYFNLLQSYVWLWNKFQFAFYQIQLAKQIKVSLSNKINQILINDQYLSLANSKIKNNQNNSHRPQQQVNFKIITKGKSESKQPAIKKFKFIQQLRNEQAKRKQSISVSREGAFAEIHSQILNSDVSQEIQDSNTELNLNLNKNIHKKINKIILDSKQIRIIQKNKQKHNTDIENASVKGGQFADKRKLKLKQPKSKEQIKKIKRFIRFAYKYANLKKYQFRKHSTIFLKRKFKRLTSFYSDIKVKAQLKIKTIKRCKTL